MVYIISLIKFAPFSIIYIIVIMLTFSNKEIISLYDNLKRESLIAEISNKMSNIEVAINIYGKHNIYIEKKDWKQALVDAKILTVFPDFKFVKNRLDIKISKNIDKILIQRIPEDICRDIKRKNIITMSCSNNTIQFLI